MIADVLCVVCCFVGLRSLNLRLRQQLPQPLKNIIMRKWTAVSCISTMLAASHHHQTLVCILFMPSTCKNSALKPVGWQLCKMDEVLSKLACAYEEFWCLTYEDTPDRDGWRMRKGG